MPKSLLQEDHKSSVLHGPVKGSCRHCSGPPHLHSRTVRYWGAIITGHICARSEAAGFRATSVRPLFILIQSPPQRPYKLQDSLPLTKSNGDTCMSGESLLGVPRRLISSSGRVYTTDFGCPVEEFRYGVRPAHGTCCSAVNSKKGLPRTIASCFSGPESQSATL